MISLGSFHHLRRDIKIPSVEEAFKEFGRAKRLAGLSSAQRRGEMWLIFLCHSRVQDIGYKV